MDTHPVNVDTPGSGLGDIAYDAFSKINLDVAQVVGALNGATKIPTLDTNAYTTIEGDELLFLSVTPDGAIASVYLASADTFGDGAIQVIEKGDSGAFPVLVYSDDLTTLLGQLLTQGDKIAIRTDALVWKVYARDAFLKKFKYAAATDTDNFTATAAQCSGAEEVTLQLTGNLGAGKAITLPTAAEIVAAIPNPVIGQSYKLKIISSGSGNFAWTVTTNTGLTLTGTMTVAQNTERNFYVELTSLTAVAVQSLGQIIRAA